MSCETDKRRTPPFVFRPQDLPETMPLFPLSGVMLLPRGRLPLNVYEPRYLAMVERALAHKRLIGMIQPTGEASLCGKPKLFQVGCAGRIHSFSETEDGRFLIGLTGIARFRVAAEIAMTEGFRNIRADWTPYLGDLETPRPCCVDREALNARIRAYFQLHGIAADFEAVEKTCDERLISSLAMICPFSPCEKQALLEAATMEDRCRLLMTLMGMAGEAGHASPCDMIRH